MQAPSHALLGIQHDKENTERISLSAIAKVYARADLDEVHEMLENDGYCEDERATFEVLTFCQLSLS